MHFVYGTLNRVYEMLIYLFFQPLYQNKNAWLSTCTMGLFVFAIIYNLTKQGSVFGVGVYVIVCFSTVNGASIVVSLYVT